MSTLNKTMTLDNVSVQMEEKRILEAINCQLEGQKIYALIGPSGAGKTTLLHVLAGLQEVVSGKITFAGQSPKEAVISLVPQDYGLLPWQTVKQAILAGRQISLGKQLTASDNTVVDELLARMELTQLIDSYPNQLSGGQKQRVAITRGLASQSDLLLLDEPFSALDTFTREKAQQLFLESWQQVKRLTVLVTHDIEEALLLAHEVIILEANPGRIKKIIPSPFQDKERLSDYRQTEQLFTTSLVIRKEIAG